MSRVRVGVKRSSVLASRSTLLLVVAAALLSAQPGGYAQTPRPAALKLFKNYFLAGGDYLVGGVGLRGQGDPSTGWAIGTIRLDHVEDVPETADISAAFLYWATLEPTGTAPQSAEARFRGQPFYGKMIGPAERVPGCWGSGGGGGATSSTTQLRVYRADVLRGFPTSTDAKTPRQAPDPG
jgi:hypothetical protein